MSRMELSPFFLEDITCVVATESLEKYDAIFDIPVHTSVDIFKGCFCTGSYFY